MKTLTISEKEYTTFKKFEKFIEDEQFVYFLNFFNDENIKTKFFQFIEIIESEKKHDNTKKEKIERQLGFFPKGTFILADDFDAPLDCFNEYM